MEVIDTISLVLLAGLAVCMLGALGYMSFYIVDKGGNDV